MKRIVALLPSLLVSAIALGFILPILAKVFRHGFMTKVDVGFYTFGVVLLLQSGRMAFARAKQVFLRGT